MMNNSDGTTSTNHGATFRIYTTALLALRCCRRNEEDVSIMINNNKYRPWHDLVLHYKNQTVCVLTTHESEVNRKKLKSDLNERQRIVKENATPLIFVRLAIASDDTLKFLKPDRIPEPLKLFITNDSVFFDKSGSTYFCTKQHDVTALETDIEDALVDVIGKDFISKSELRKLQPIFIKFVEDHFYRLTQQDSLSVSEVRRYLGYVILGLFKMPCIKLTGKKQVVGDLNGLLKENVVVLNHRQKSVVKENVWRFLRSAYGDGFEQSQVDNLWFLGKLHVPLLSCDARTDRMILRGLQMTGFEAKVLVLRPRMFAFKDVGRILTILQNLPVNDSVAFSVGADEETFKWVKLRPNELRLEDAHRDLFCRVARDFGCEKAVVEAHDDFNYINEEVVVGKEPLTPLIAAIKTPGVELSVVESLIELGANVNNAVIGGHVPLYFAVQVDRADLAELLLDRGANPELADKYGNVPLLYACMEAKTQIVELLLKYNCNRNAADYYGVSSIFIAYRAKNYEILRLLLKDNERPIAADVNGSHVLHRAAIDNDVDCLKCVLESIPDVNVFMVGDAQGQTPLDLAQVEFAKMLKDALRIE